MTSAKKSKIRTLTLLPFPQPSNFGLCLAQPWLSLINSRYPSEISKFSLKSFTLISTQKRLAFFFANTHNIYYSDNIIKLTESEQTFTKPTFVKG